MSKSKTAALVQPLSVATHLLARSEQRVIVFAIVLGAILLVASWVPDVIAFFSGGGKIGGGTGVAHVTWQQWLREHWQVKAREAASFLFSASAMVAVVLAYLRQGGAHVDRFRVRFLFRRHTIICGMSTRGKILANDLAASGESVVIINLDEKLAETTEERVKGVCVLQGNATNPEVLRNASLHRAAHLVCLTGSDETNIAILEAARTLSHEAQTLKGQEFELDCFCHVGNVGLRNHMEQLTLLGSKARGTRFRLFNVDEITAADLLAKYPPERHLPLERQADGVHVTLLGGGAVAAANGASSGFPAGGLAHALAIEMAQMCHYWRRDVEATSLPRATLAIVDMAADSIVRNLRQMCPAIDQLLNLRPIACAPTDLALLSQLHAAAIPETSQFYVALQDDISTLAIATHVAAGFARRFQDYAGKVVAVMPPRVHRIDPNAWNRSAAVAVFQSYDSCTEEVVIGGARDRMATAAHARYLESARQKGREMGSRPAMFDWQNLGEFLRASNRKQVAHIATKLRVLSWEMVRPVAVKGDEIVEALDLGGEMLEHLAEMEHRRWMAFHLVHGWTPSDSYREETREHDCLVPYCRLTEDIKAYDRDVVREMAAVSRAAGFTLRRIA